MVQLLDGKVYMHQYKINAKSAFTGAVWQWHQDYGTWKRDDGMLEPRAMNVFIFPPSLDVLEQRLRGRSKDSDDAIRKRLEVAREEGLKFRLALVRSEQGPRLVLMAGNRQQRQWIIMAAKEQKLMPTLEGGLDLKLNLTQVLDGYPGLEHTLPIMPLYKDVVQLVAQSGIVYTPTLLVLYGGPGAEELFYVNENPHAPSPSFVAVAATPADTETATVRM